ncbi:MAG: type I-E CRISPR-associated endonuclease Cas1 [Armatimonadetes bacterium]|nr:type I-E CRISPR-associated endonuclease Cas1 [Armatimonadota bacterium]
MDDLHQLPKFREALSYVYLEHVRIDRHECSVSVWDDAGELPLPAAGLNVLMLGPGTTITHAAVDALADNNCLVVWCGEEMVRFYAFGTGGTQSSVRLLHQARAFADEAARMEVVRRMYLLRFEEVPPAHYTIEQLRGMEGARVRKAYAEASAECGVPWHGRHYNHADWEQADPANKALSAANSCLYGLAHAAIVSAGYSPAIGFIHTGHMRSFVLDIADLYKADLTIPLAFRMAALPLTMPIERATRIACRDLFREFKLLERIIPDIEKVLGKPSAAELAEAEAVDSNPDEPLPLAGSDLPGGANHAPREEG